MSETTEFIKGLQAGAMKAELLMDRNKDWCLKCRIQVTPYGVEVYAHAGKLGYPIHKIVYNCTWKELINNHRYVGDMVDMTVIKVLRAAKGFNPNVYSEKNRLEQGQTPAAGGEQVAGEVVSGPPPGGV